MLSHNFAVYGSKIFAEIIGDILYFPLWWYSRGLAGVVRGLRRFLSDREKSLALLVWIKNIHRPMYGQYDWQGVLISFVMRVVQIIFRSILMVFWLAAAVFALFAWLILPVAAYYGIISQF